MQRAKELASVGYPEHQLRGAAGHAGHGWRASRRYLTCNLRGEPNIRLWVSSDLMARGGLQNWKVCRQAKVDVGN